jgi:hypothetical protein
MKDYQLLVLIAGMYSAVWLLLNGEADKTRSATWVMCLIAFAAILVE